MRDLMSVKEARKLLGKDGKNLTDEEVEKVVNNLSAIADGFIKQYTTDEEFRKKVIKYSQDKKTSNK